jgi:cytochrome b561
MTGPPSHPDTDTAGQASGAPPSSRQRARRPRWQTAAIAIIVIALLAVMVILHLTGTLGAGSHG